MPATSYLEALLQGKCPKCRQGQIFKYPATKLGKFTIMNERCPHCDIRLEPEPGFYQGSMYVSYGFTVAFLVTMSIFFYLFLPNRSEWLYIGIFIAIMVFLIPVNYRYSRILYLYFFGGIKYEKDQA
ncbi:MAG TPA: DUF983 domain-containing protein [Ohtaekwangia sp.]|uniref:DUF983 domain-containing protein n=1 Tax=Ohtaekwangia sp. TaxID=2066019 RepID=UPI002F959B89